MPSHPKKAVEAMEHAFKAGLGNIGKEDRHRLAKETGLTPHQISKWASGKRRREWREKNCSRTAGSEKLKRPQKPQKTIVQPTTPEPFRFLTPVDQLTMKHFLHVRNSSSLALVNLLQHMFIANQVSARFNPNLYFFNLFLIMN
uniref:Homeobox domain-containing protein n=1 Tax=Caenorhabditis japonica TaxID=281687 RepID=A0A8R1IQV0_CAEJA